MLQKSKDLPKVLCHTSQPYVSILGKTMNYVTLKDVQVNSVKMRQRKGQKAMKVTSFFLLRQKETFFPYQFYA